MLVDVGEVGPRPMASAALRHARAVTGRFSVIGRKWARRHVLYPDAGAGADREPAPFVRACRTSAR